MSTMALVSRIPLRITCCYSRLVSEGLSSVGKEASSHQNPLIKQFACAALKAVKQEPSVSSLSDAVKIRGARICVGVAKDEPPFYAFFAGQIIARSDSLPPSLSDYPLFLKDSKGNLVLFA